MTKANPNQLQLFGIIEDSYLFVEYIIFDFKDYIYGLLISALTKKEIAFAIDRARDFSGYVKRKYYTPVLDAVVNPQKRRRFTMNFLLWLQEFTRKNFYSSQYKNIRKAEFEQFKMDKKNGKLPFNLKYSF